MDLSKAVACTALVIIVVLTAGHAFSQDKPTAAVAAEEAAKTQEAVEARERAAQEKREARREIEEEIARRCHIKPVMTDAEIDGCRVAYRLY
jgi:LmbE family N-acetylglucosaminyl deacetylase